jgi:hypothetical protein
MFRGVMLCRDLFIVMLNFVMLIGIMLNIVILCGIMLRFMVLGRFFVPWKPLQPILMFVSKAGAYPSEAPFRCFTLE